MEEPKLPVQGNLHVVKVTWPKGGLDTDTLN